MNICHNRIRDIRFERRMTLQQLAEASGTTKSQIDKLEKGQRRLTVDWMARIAKALDCDLRDLLSQSVIGCKDNQAAAQTTSIPIKGTEYCAKSQKSFLVETAVDMITRPYCLTHVKDAYAIYMTEECMSPMYRPRQLLFINPYKPPVPGNGVVIIQPDGAVVVREFIKRKPVGIVLREYNPSKRDTTVGNAEVSSLHTVVGAMEPS